MCRLVTDSACNLSAFTSASVHTPCTAQCAASSVATCTPSKKRTRSSTATVCDTAVAKHSTPKTTRISTPASLRSLESATNTPVVHYNLRTKRTRPSAATAAVVERHASPRTNASKMKKNCSDDLHDDLHGEVQMLQSKVERMQTQVQDAASGIRQLRQMVAVLALQRRRAQVLAHYRHAHLLQQQQQQSQSQQSQQSQQLQAVEV